MEGWTPRGRLRQPGGRYGGSVATIRRVAPGFPVGNLEAAFAHYRRLGFATRTYEGGGYGFVTRDGVELHLGVVPDVDNTGAKHTTYRPEYWDPEPRQSDPSKPAGQRIARARPRADRPRRRTHSFP